MSSARFKYVFKYIIIGNPSVGKSCLLNQFLNNRFSDEYEITVGVEFGAKTVNIEDGNKVKLQIWDTAGQESFKSITRGYYRSAAVGLIVYDVTSRESFENIGSWLKECKQHGNKEMTLVLVGNKIDLENEREVTYEEAEQYANQNDMLFFETSAKTSNHVLDLFVQSANKVNKKIEDGLIDPKNEIYGVKTGTIYNTDNLILKKERLQKKDKSKCC